MRGGQLRGLGSRDSKRDLFSRLLFRELRGEPRTVKLDSVRAVSIESILDVEGVLKSCVLLGFSRSGDQLISYSTAADGEFSLEVWHFLGVGKRVQLASRSALFRSEDGPSGSQSGAARKVARSLCFPQRRSLPGTHRKGLPRAQPSPAHTPSQRTGLKRTSDAGAAPLLPAQTAGIGRPLSSPWPSWATTLASSFTDSRQRTRESTPRPSGIS